MTKANSESAASTTAVDLNHLRQAQVAFLIGKPSSWVRDNSQRFNRDDGGRYDARQVVQAMRQVGPSVAELSDEHLEALQHWLYAVNSSEGCLTGCLRVVEEIEAAHGTVGLAAIGQMVKEIAAKHLRHFPESFESAEQIRAGRLIEIENAEAVAKAANAARDMRVVLVCDSCGKYRWGRKWLELPIPTGYISSQGTCDDCWETSSGPSRN